MLSTAKSSMRSTNETNGILNNNTVDAIKLNDSPVNPSSVSVLSTFDECAAQKLMAQTESDVTLESALSPAAAATAESSKKVTGTWCPPIQANVQLTEINGKKPLKIPSKEDQSGEKKESAPGRLIERVVRAPCVKLEPQEPLLSVKSPSLMSENVAEAFMTIKPEPLLSCSSGSANTPLLQLPKDPVPRVPVSLFSTSTPQALALLNNSVSQNLPSVTEPVAVTSTTILKTSNTDSFNISRNDPNMVFVALAPKVSQGALESVPSSLVNKPELEINRNLTSSQSNQTRKPCNCTRSSCLKLYCECFANGIPCNGCNCTNCHNNPDHSEERNRAIKMILDRNPCAFQSKIRRQYGHVKGCNCKKSNCLKNYCECYEAKIACTNLCRCFGCQNVDPAPSQISLEFLKKSVVIPKGDVAQKCGINAGAPVPSTSAAATELNVDPVALATAKQQIAARLAEKRENEGGEANSLPSRSQTPPVKPVRRPIHKRPRASLPVGRIIAPSPSAQPPKSVASPSPDASGDPVLPNLVEAPPPLSESSAGPATSLPGATTPSCPTLVPAPSKAASSSSSLSDTINEVVAAALKSANAPRSKPNARRAQNSSSPLPKRARVTFGGEGSVYSPDSTCLTLPIIDGDDGSSEASGGPREDEFTAEELAMMQRIRQRAVHSTDTSTSASNSTTNNRNWDGANSVSPPAPPGDDSPLALEQCPNGVLDANEARRDASLGATTALSIDLAASSETVAQSQTTAGEANSNASFGAGGGASSDPETPRNILSFLQTSQQQIESALGAGVTPVTLTTASGGGTNLLYTILTTNTASNTTQTLVPISKAGHPTATLVSAMALRPCCNATGGVVHWRPQQHQQTSPILLQQQQSSSVPTLVAAPVAADQQQPSQQQVPSTPVQHIHVNALPSANSPAPSPSSNPAERAPSLSQLADLVSGERGLRSQVLSLERQVCAMRRSQQRQTRLLAAIHRTLMRRQPSPFWDAASRRRRLFSGRKHSADLEKAKKRKEEEKEEIAEKEEAEEKMEEAEEKMEEAGMD